MKKALWAAAVAALFVVPIAAPAANTLKSEMPAQFTPKTESFDYERRDVMIPMRDGVKLKTVILIPKGAQRAPILLTRTPYGAAGRISRNSSEHLSEVLAGSDVADELVLEKHYIRVLQDIRGKHGSEGDYVMNRPLRGPLNPTEIDHATDTYDTIDWLVKNLPESNGKVGIYGISYDGFTSLMALFHPHPALKAAIPINSMVDGWMGDDWFHYGAFRQDSLAYAYDQQATRDSEVKWWSDAYDDYDSWLRAGSAADMAKKHGLETIGFAQKLMQHPAYDEFWQNQAVDKLLAKEPLSVPTMLVHSLWDQEDIYGNLAVYEAIKNKDPSKLFLVLGPWFHHQQRLDGSHIGAIRFGSDTAAYFRHVLLRNFFEHYLEDNGPALTISHVTAFETGSNEWRRLEAWPGIKPEDKKLYLQPAGRLAFTVPAAQEPGFVDYVSDPAKPVPYLPRPINIGGEGGEFVWENWLVSDQRDAASRPDVVSFTSDVLTAPLKISGHPIANLIAATSGTDGDFVVKLIDVYPDQVGRQPEMGGYQLMVAADIFRGRYRESFAKPSPIPADQPQSYHFALPAANHVFLPGHRLMVQIQSSWFPLYDRNPQTYVDNIFFAKPEDYKKATIKVYDAGDKASFIALPVVEN